MGVIHEVLEYLGLDIPVAGLAKNDRHRTSELLCGFPPVLVGIRPTSPLFHFLAHIQEEVHRFAIAFHRQKRSKAFIHSELEQIEGIGDKTVRTLLQHFRTVAKVKAAPFEELTALVGPAKAKKSRLSLKNNRIFENCEESTIFALPILRKRLARMAESVDALVSNTNDSNVVPVRPRLRYF